LPDIILTGNATVDGAVAAIKAGAADFLEKDVHLSDRVNVSLEKIERMLCAIRDNRRLKRENRYLRAEQERVHALVAGEGLGPVMERVEKVARVPRPVMVLGERGTGKELVAHEIHRRSLRTEGPLVVFNCAAVAESLLESELFGHEKGAFTGASARKAGRFELADGGTLFLDEVADMSEAFQAKVLRAVEYQRFERVAGTHLLEVDVRVVSATNADMKQRIAQGRFRADLYDRLAFEVIELPPLRTRKQDIPALARHFLARFAQEAHTRPRELSAGALAALSAYDFPGNVRELKHVIERAAYRSEADQLSREAVESALPARSGVGAAGSPESAAASGSFEERTAAFEKAMLLKALQDCHYSQKDAAERLALTYDQFRHMYRKYGLKEET
ncbi:MAG: sigma 54-interacting transcriptional regulator, partial [Deltaproteobacteria bacterium]|nr:sigma 54-interacting transcriptional regulator [Deltaproteobacteria bacterium]